MCAHSVKEGMARYESFMEVARDICNASSVAGRSVYRQLFMAYAGGAVRRIVNENNYALAPQEFDALGTGTSTASGLVYMTATHDENDLCANTLAAFVSALLLGVPDTTVTILCASEERSMRLLNMIRFIVRSYDAIEPVIPFGDHRNVSSMRLRCLVNRQGHRYPLGDMNDGPPGTLNHTSDAVAIEPAHLIDTIVIDDLCALPVRDWHDVVVPHLRRADTLCIAVAIPPPPCGSFYADALERVAQHDDHDAVMEALL